MNTKTATLIKNLDLTEHARIDLYELSAPLPGNSSNFVAVAAFQHEMLEFRRSIIWESDKTGELVKFRKAIAETPFPYTTGALRSLGYHIRR